MDRKSNQTPWWNRESHEDRLPFLRSRGRIRTAVRAWFEAQGFTEVETGCLQTSPGNEAHLHAFQTELIGTDLSRQRLYLHTSPELACKKLLAAGEKKIFSMGPVFRNRERGPLHAPEFTILEWYRADAPYEDVMADCLALLKVAADVAETSEWHWHSVACDPRQEAQHLTVAEAFEQVAGIDVLATLKAAGPDRDVLAAQAAAAGINVKDDDTWSDIFSRIVVTIEPRLGVGTPTLLTEYPTVEAALARSCVHDVHVSERFELYCCGVELANGFGELTDPEEQRRRLQAEMAKRQARHGERYPLDEDFLAALSHVPPASGCALGFDRLVMLATGATRIDQVLWTPLPEPGQ
ncbi:MAG: EF-P lysine aminoacylase EpmA [Hyphomicrobium sp.]